MKTKSFKTLVSALLAVIMLMSLISMSAVAATYGNDGNITSTSFTLQNFAYGKTIISGNAVGEKSVAWVNSTKFYESKKGTPTGKDDLNETTDSFFQAGKQYYCEIDFSEHIDLGGETYFDRALTATLTCNGASCERVLDLSGNTKVFVYKLPVLEAVPYGIDVTTVIKQGGNVAPAKGAFELEVLNAEENSNLPINNFTLGGKDISTDGKGNFDSKLTIVNNDYEKFFFLLYEGILVKQKKGTAEGWTYDEAVWFVQLHQEPAVNALNYKVETLPDISFDCIKGKMVDGEFKADSNTPADKITFTNTYTENKAVEPSSPQTGDNSMMGLWIALLFVSGFGVVATTVISKKRSVR